MQRDIPPPLEGHTFLKCPTVTIEDLVPGVAAVIGVPFDATKVSRLGARDGPQAIREATFVFAFLMDATPGGFVDLDADLRFERAPELKLVDLGNVPAVPIDVEGTSRRVSDRVAAVVARGGFRSSSGATISSPTPRCVASPRASGRRIPAAGWDMCTSTCIWTSRTTCRTGGSTRVAHRRG